MPKPETCTKAPSVTWKIWTPPAAAFADAVAGVQVRESGQFPNGRCPQSMLPFCFRNG